MPLLTPTLFFTCLATASLVLPRSGMAEEADTEIEEKTESAVEAVVGALDSADYGPTPLRSTDEGHVEMLVVPAPRGTVTTSDGQPIAISKATQRLTARLGALGDTPEEISRALRELPEPIASFASLNLPDEKAIADHLKNRAWLPCAISMALSDEELEHLEEQELPELFSRETVYLRTYPQKDLFAHVTGYIGEEMPRQHGPIAETEYLWPPVIGRAGLEKTLHDELRGKSGEIIRLYNAKGELRHHVTASEPVPGHTVETTLNLEMQRLAARMLEKTGRPGAFVAIDADTGDILAMVSYPSFDPNLFIPRISHETFREIADHPEAPFFDRAITGVYPPGSTWKPFVALAGMDYGTIDGIETQLPGPATMEIGGREFKNWGETPEGLMDFRYALTRSTNTWFYQAGLEMGLEPIIDVAHQFGFGQAPELPLPAVGKGNLPEARASGPPDDLFEIANSSIGQGDILVSPLQLALSMAGLANGEFVPKPRLVRALRDAGTGEIVEEYGIETASRITLEKESIELVREGMWGVVNHRRGTARVAAMRLPAVYGKTGTSQWAVDGKLRSLAWFAGWVDAESPRIAFAAVSQGRPGETLSGGRNAAPIASGFLKTAYGSPEKYAVTKPSTLLTQAPNLAVPYTAPAITAPVATVRRGPVFGLFRGVFNRRDSSSSSGGSSSSSRKSRLFGSGRRLPSSN